MVSQALVGKYSKVTESKFNVRISYYYFILGSGMMSQVNNLSVGEQEIVLSMSVST